MEKGRNISREKETQLEEIFKTYEAKIKDLQEKLKESETDSKDLLQKSRDIELLGQELKQKASKASNSYYRLEQLINATNIPILFLDKKLRILHYTPEIQKVFVRAEFDIGKLLSDVLKISTFEKLNRQIQDFLQNAVEKEVLFYLKELQKWYVAHILPYSAATGDDIDGIVITFLNITEDKEYEKKLNKLNQTLELQIQKQNQQVKKLASELIVAEQKERKRIARLLHNDLQQLLFSIQTKAKLLEEEIPAPYTREINEIIDHIGLSLQLTNQLVVSLNPPNIDNNNLHKGVNWLCQYMDNFHGLTVDSKCPRHLELENKDVLVLLLQMIQEFLFNVVKHAGVNEAAITIEEKEKEILICIIDKGKGFSQDEVDNMVSYGISKTKEQLELIGGDLLIDSTPGKGTNVCISLPSKDYIK